MLRRFDAFAKGTGSCTRRRSVSYGGVVFAPLAETLAVQSTRAG